MDPQALVPGSPMPRYAHLFIDGRGDDLVRYLVESGVGAMADVMASASAWKPAQSGAVGGSGLYAAHCAVCHGEDAGGVGLLADRFLRPPANLVQGPFLWTAPGDGLELRMARVIKFGIVGTDMPGHEVLTDEQINGLVTEVIGFRKP
jgi:cytochrome c oxidase cbb3-type subunit 2